MKPDILDIFVRAALSLDEINREILGLMVAGHYRRVEKRICEALEKGAHLEQFCMAFYHAADKDLGIQEAIEDLVAEQPTIEEQIDDEGLATG